MDRQCRNDVLKGRPDSSRVAAPQYLLRVGKRLLAAGAVFGSLQPQRSQIIDTSSTAPRPREPWNEGNLVGQKSPLKLKDIWAIRIRLQIAGRVRDLALFDLAIDSKLSACDLVKLRVRDVAQGKRVACRAIVMQQKTQRPVQFEITEQTREVELPRLRGRLRA